MTEAPMIIFERSDRVLSGALVAVRAVGLHEEDDVRSAVAITLQVHATSCQVSDDGTVTATLLIAPGEALGVSRWLREAAQSLTDVGRPLFEEDPDTSPEDPDTSPEDPDTAPEDPDASPEDPDASPEDPDASPEDPDTAPEDPDASPEDPDASPEDSSVKG